MKPRFLVLTTICFLFLYTATAQMSPFDGSYTVLVKVKENNLPADVRLELREISLPSDSCSFSPKLIRIQFQLPGNVLIKNRNNNKIWEERAQEYAKDASFMAPGYFAVVLNHGERECMIPSGNGYNGYEYLTRRFQIVAVQKNKETILVTVPEERVYDLSRMRGRWSEMMAMEVTLR